MALEQKDLESFERLIYKSGDDVAVSISRSFERLEERLDAMETRIYARLTDFEERADIRPRHGFAPDNLPVEPEREDE